MRPAVALILALFAVDLLGGAWVWVHVTAPILVDLERQMEAPSNGP